MSPGELGHVSKCLILYPRSVKVRGCGCCSCELERGGGGSWLIGSSSVEGRSMCAFVGARSGVH